MRDYRELAMTACSSARGREPEEKSTPRSRSRRESSSSRSGTSTTRDGRVPVKKGLSFGRCTCTAGCSNGLLPHAVDDVEDYDVREGELIRTSSTLELGDAHFHGKAAARGDSERMRFGAEEVRVIFLESVAHRTGVGRPALRGWGTVAGLVVEGSSWCGPDRTASPGSMSATTCRSRSIPARPWATSQSRSLERRGRRRLGPQRACLRRRAGSEWRAGDGARGPGDHRRRHPHQRAHRPGTAA